MRIPDCGFEVVNWSAVGESRHPRETGAALWRTIELRGKGGDSGELRIRQVEYQPGYLADHWCERGHVVLVLAGELVTELRDGRRFVLTPGMGYHVADGRSAHRSSTAIGAKLFIVD